MVQLTPNEERAVRLTLAIMPFIATDGVALVAMLHTAALWAGRHCKRDATAENTMRDTMLDAVRHAFDQGLTERK